MYDIVYMVYHVRCMVYYINSNKNIDKLTKKQKYIAKQSGNPNKIESSDFKALRKK